MSFSDKKESVWNILDKIIQASLHFKAVFMGTKAINNDRLTIKLSDFKDSCGYTKEVHDELFQRSNKQNTLRRNEIKKKFHIEFENMSQSYNKRKMSFLHANAPPLLQLYFNHADVGDDHELQADDDDINIWPRHILVEHMNEERIIIKSNNNKRCQYHKIPKAEEIISDYGHFRHCMTSTRMSKILEILAGETAAGVTFLTQLVYNINPDACKKGLQQCGAGVLNQLNPTQTLGLQYGCGLSATQRIYIARYLRYFNNMKPVLSSEKQCMMVKPKYIVPPVFGSYIYVPPDKVDILDQDSVTIEIEYWYK